MAIDMNTVYVLSIQHTLVGLDTQRTYATAEKAMEALIAVQDNTPYPQGLKAQIERVETKVIYQVNS